MWVNCCHKKFCTSLENFVMNKALVEPNPLIICRIEGALSSISLATERVPPQEIPLHTTQLICLILSLILFSWYAVALNKQFKNKQFFSTK